MENETYERMAELQREHWWYQGRRTIIAAYLTKLSIKQPARILEAGCGPGGNLLMLKQFGKVSAFEPSGFARRHAEMISGITVMEGQLPASIPFTEQFELIAALDVIEHVSNDLDSLRALRKLTSPAGHAVFTVPAFNFLWSEHDEKNHHFRRYSISEFRRLLESAGYSVSYISYYNTILFPLVLLVRAFKVCFGLRNSPDDQMPRNRLINKALLHIFSAERFFLGKFRFPFGVSIFAACTADQRIDSETNE